MAKIAPVSSKYIVHASIQVTGVVDRPDIIGAIFGQTEGLLGADLELRELQRSGRIGRIEVNAETKGGKTAGEIIIPSSLDKAETAIIAASLETIQRIGPCNAKIVTENIEDIRISKRGFVIERAKELLKRLMDSTMPDSQELSDEVSASVRMMEIAEYGKSRSPSGPGIAEADEIIVVEGRADVLNLLKYGFKNIIAIGGTGVPPDVAELTKGKTTTAFVDGDRGGDLIIKELMAVGEIDFITKAPDGKEVEELTKKEIHKALRGKIAIEQYHFEDGSKAQSGDGQRERRPQHQQRDNQQDYGQRRPQQQSSMPPQRNAGPVSQQRPQQQQQSSQDAAPMRKATMKPEEKEAFKTMVEDLVGTRGAFILDEKLDILGKVPTTELNSTIKSLNSGIYAVILDGVIDKDLAASCEKSRVKYVVAMNSDVKPGTVRVNIITGAEL